ncbi:hypothetical protein F5Y05DRAFT_381587 [Hypoxylon sp. FL0543]|nr:hypothetical protein F5Y05DRAFT_381587 [Hypoxylon sp. FL0543]
MGRVMARATPATSTRAADWSLRLLRVAPSWRKKLLRPVTRTDVRPHNITSQAETAVVLSTRRLPALLPLVEQRRARE